MNCRACGSHLSVKMIDLGAAPPSNAFNASQDVLEEHYPLRVWVCLACGLAQTDITMFKLNHDQLFVEDYPYYSSTSTQCVEHARRYVEQMTYTLNLNQSSLTVEVGCNDGYLLQWMTTPCYGIEPTGTAAAAREHGLTVLSEFFGEACGRALARSRKADLMVCNNVLAHVPDVNDFVRGFAALLAPQGVATFEFPHLLNLIRGSQFDTIYHEHYSYLSLTAVVNLLKRAHLTVFGVEKLSTHGGSLRVHAQHEGGPHRLDESVVLVLAEEKCLAEPAFYDAFQANADRVKNDLLFFLLQARSLSQTVVGFGAAAKANTLLNYAGIRADLIPYVVDETPAKHGKFMPGSRIPVVPEFGDRPDYVVVFPWNYREEISAKLGLMRAAGTRLVFAIPHLEIV